MFNLLACFLNIIFLLQCSASNAMVTLTSPKTKNDAISIQSEVIPKKIDKFCEDEFERIIENMKEKIEPILDSFDEEFEKYFQNEESASKVKDIILDCLVLQRKFFCIEADYYHSDQKFSGYIQLTSYLASKGISLNTIHPSLKKIYEIYKENHQKIQREKSSSIINLFDEFFNLFFTQMTNNIIEGRILSNDKKIDVSFDSLYEKLYKILDQGWVCKYLIDAGKQIINENKDFIFVFQYNNTDRLLIIEKPLNKLTSKLNKRSFNLHFHKKLSKKEFLSDPHAHLGEFPVLLEPIQQVQQTKNFLGNIISTGKKIFYTNKKKFKDLTLKDVSENKISIDFILDVDPSSKDFELIKANFIINIEASFAEKQKIFSIFSAPYPLIINAKAMTNNRSHNKAQNACTDYLRLTDQNNNTPRVNNTKQLIIVNKKNKTKHEFDTFDWPNISSIKDISFGNKIRKIKKEYARDAESEKNLSNYIKDGYGKQKLSLSNFLLNEGMFENVPTDIDFHNYEKIYSTCKKNLEIIISNLTEIDLIDDKSIKIYIENIKNMMQFIKSISDKNKKYQREDKEQAIEKMELKFYRSFMPILKAVIPAYQENGRITDQSILTSINAFIGNYIVNIKQFTEKTFTDFSLFILDLLELSGNDQNYKTLFTFETFFTIILKNDLQYRNGLTVEHRPYSTDTLDPSSPEYDFCLLLALKGNYTIRYEPLNQKNLLKWNNFICRLGKKLENFLAQLTSNNNDDFRKKIKEFQELYTKISNIPPPINQNLNDTPDIQNDAESEIKINIENSNIKNKDESVVESERKELIPQTMSQKDINETFDKIDWPNISFINEELFKKKIDIIKEECKQNNWYGFQEKDLTDYIKNHYRKQLIPILKILFGTYENSSFTKLVSLISNNAQLSLDEFYNKLCKHTVENTIGLQNMKAINLLDDIYFYKDWESKIKALHSCIGNLALIGSVHPDKFSDGDTSLTTYFTFIFYDLFRTKNPFESYGHSSSDVNFIKEILLKFADSERVNYTKKCYTCITDLLSILVGIRNGDFQSFSESFLLNNYINKFILECSKAPIPLFFPYSLLFFFLKSIKCDAFCFNLFLDNNFMTHISKHTQEEIKFNKDLDKEASVADYNSRIKCIRSLKKTLIALNATYQKECTPAQQKVLKDSRKTLNELLRKHLSLEDEEFKNDFNEFEEILQTNDNCDNMRIDTPYGIKGRIAKEFRYREKYKKVQDKSNNNTISGKIRNKVLAFFGHQDKELVTTQHNSNVNISSNTETEKDEDGEEIEADEKKDNTDQQKNVSKKESKIIIEEIEVENEAIEITDPPKENLTKHQDENGKKIIHNKYNLILLFIKKYIFKTVGGIGLLCGIWYMQKIISKITKSGAAELPNQENIIKNMALNNIKIFSESFFEFLKKFTNIKHNPPVVFLYAIATLFYYDHQQINFHEFFNNIELRYFLFFIAIILQYPYAFYKKFMI